MSEPVTEHAGGDQDEYRLVRVKLPGLLSGGSPEGGTAEESVRKGLDPFLQDVLLRQIEGLIGSNLPAEGADLDWATVVKDDPPDKGQVHVIVKLDVERNSGVKIGKEHKLGGKSGKFATGIISYKDIPGLHSQVESLKKARPLTLYLRESVPALCCRQDDLRAAFPAVAGGIDGSNVIVGVVDRGCDFAHRNFRQPASGATRLLALWDQGYHRSSKGFGPPKDFGYGREFSSAQINTALAQQDPYGFLDYKLDAGAHGTAVLDVAAGNGLGTGSPGMAPNADLIFVDLALDDADESHGSFGNSRNLLDAVDYIFAQAEKLKRPAVVNLSLGLHGGPHDGSTPVEQALDDFLAGEAGRGRAIVLAAGNTGGQPIHTQGKVRQGEDKMLTWVFTGTQEEESEIWYEGKSAEKDSETGEPRDLKVDVHLITPEGKNLGAVSPGETCILALGKKAVGSVIHRQHDPNNQDNQVLLRVPAPAAAPPGSRRAWTIRLTTQEPKFVRYHAWIEADAFRQSQFADDETTDTHGLGSICCGANTITVGAFDAHLSQRPAASFSAPGPLRRLPPGVTEDRRKPELLAPGNEIATARARFASAPLLSSGTSLAAPHVAGLVALLFQVAGSRRLSIDETRQILFQTARRDFTDSAQGLQIGFGRIDGIEALKKLFSLLDPTAAVAAPNGKGNYVTADTMIAALQQMINSLNPVP